MKKTFIEFLNELDKNEMVYVGTKNGTNWIVIDKPDKIIEILDNIEKELHAQVQRTYDVAHEKVVGIPSLLVKERKQLTKLMKITNRDVRDLINETRGRIYKLESTFVSAFGTRKKYRKILDKWIDIRDRKVVDIYEHETDISGVSVILEGYGDGTLWWYGEKNI